MSWMKHCTRTATPTHELTPCAAWPRRDCKEMGSLPARNARQSMPDCASNAWRVSYPVYQHQSTSSNSCGFWIEWDNVPGATKQVFYKLQLFTLPLGWLINYLSRPGDLTLDDQRQLANQKTADNGQYDKHRSHLLPWVSRLGATSDFVAHLTVVVQNMNDHRTRGHNQ